MCCALAEGVRSKRTSLDIKTLDTIIQEAKEFSDYFTSIEDNIKKHAFFLSGTSPVTFSDLCIHIRNCIALIEDLRDSSKDCSESILYSLFDLKGSLTKSVRNGLEIYLNVLQHKLENLETHSTSQIDRSQIEEIITSIDTIIKLTSLVNDKSSVIEKLTKRLLLDFAKKMSEIQV